MKQITLRWVKWSLLLVVVLLVIINYFALTEVLLYGVGELNQSLTSIGYNFDITKPFTALFNLLIPALGIIGYIVTSNSNNVVERLNKLYEAITMTQLVILVILLPLLLYFQNNLYGKTKYVTK